MKYNKDKLNSCFQPRKEKKKTDRHKWKMEDPWYHEEDSGWFSGEFGVSRYYVVIDV